MLEDGKKAQRMQTYLGWEWPLAPPTAIDVTEVAVDKPRSTASAGWVPAMFCKRVVQNAPESIGAASSAHPASRQKCRWHVATACVKVYSCAARLGMRMLPDSYATTSSNSRTGPKGYMRQKPHANASENALRACGVLDVKDESCIQSAREHFACLCRALPQACGPNNLPSLLCTGPDSEIAEVANAAQKPRILKETS